MERIMDNAKIQPYAFTEKQRYGRHIEMVITGDNRSEKTLQAALPRLALMQRRRDRLEIISLCELSNN